MENSTGERSATSRDTLLMYVIYDHPLDFPNSVVCRIHEIRDGQSRPQPAPFIVGPSVDRVRAILGGMGLYCIPRSPQDEPQIVETWL